MQEKVSKVKRNKAEQNKNWNYFLLLLLSPYFPFNVFACTAFFRFPNHILKNECTWSTGKCRQIKSFDKWYYIIMATHYVGFSLKSKATNFFPKRILELKALDQSIQSKKKFNVLCKVLIKIESTWRRESKNRPFSWLYCTVVGMSKAAVVGYL